MVSKMKTIVVLILLALPLVTCKRAPVSTTSEPIAQDGPKTAQEGNRLRKNWLVRAVNSCKLSQQRRAKCELKEVDEVENTTQGPIPAPTTTAKVSQRP